MNCPIDKKKKLKLNLLEFLRYGMNNMIWSFPKQISFRSDFRCVETFSEVS